MYPVVTSTAHNKSHLYWAIQPRFLGTLPVGEVLQSGRSKSPKDPDRFSEDQKLWMAVAEIGHLYIYIPQNSVVNSNLSVLKLFALGYKWVYPIFRAPICSMIHWLNSRFLCWNPHNLAGEFPCSAPQFRMEKSTIFTSLSQNRHLSG